MTPVGAVLEPPPVEVGARLARCPAVVRPAGRAAFAAERFRPTFHDSDGDLRELPLEVAEVVCVHAALRATLDFAWHVYGALRTIPNTEGIAEPAKDAWNALDTAAVVRIHGPTAYNFLVQPTPRRERHALLIEHFDPLLRPGGEQWLDAVLSSSSFGDKGAWQRPPKAGRYIHGVIAMTGTFFDRLDKTVISVGAQDVRFAAWRRALDFAFATTAIVALPMLATYRSYSGTWAVELVEPRLAAACGRLRDLLSGRATELLNAISPTTPEAFRRLYGEVIDRREQVGCNLVRAVLAAPAQSRFNVQEFRGRAQLEFKRGEHRREVVRAVQADDVARGLALDEEMYWALPATWERLRRASDLVNDAGYALIVNAANNRWGGEHAGHQVHNNGRCLDLDVAVPRVAGNVECVFGAARDYRRIFNLMRLKRVPRVKGQFVDMHGVRFDLVPAEGAELAPRTQRGVDRLALWIALQALQLTGMNNVLYSDFENMDASLRHLVSRLLNQSIEAVATHFKDLPLPGQPRQLLELDDHYDHLHVEAPAPDGGAVAPGAFTGFKSFAALHEKLLELALERDQNPVFLDFAFGLRDAFGARHRRHWERRAREGRPALLPVFEPALCTRLDFVGRCVPA